MKKCILIPDSFKGTLSAIEVCKVMRAAVLARFPGCEVLSVPVADGGEGTVDCFLHALPGCARVPVESTGPYGEPLTACYARAGDTAIVEMAMCAGLPLVEHRPDPEHTTTYGVGTVMRRAVQDGCTRLVVGLGGSCTTDGGAGMAAALGAVFRDAEGRSFVPTGATLGQIASIDLSPARTLLDGVTVEAMCDVKNPLCGPEGAAFVFGPQKGADETMVRRLDEALQQFAQTLKTALGADVADVPGAGAAGGMGAGVLALLGGQLRSGIDTVLDLVGYDRMLEGADMVFTGEGRIDRQSLNGKVIDGVARRARTAGVPVTCVVGSIGEGAQTAYEAGVSAIFSINRRAESFETARYKSRENLAATMEDILRFAQAVR